MELQIFENSEFGRVRTISQSDGTVLFCGSDVAKALGYSQTAKAVREHCSADGCLNQTVIDDMGRTQRARYITEGNVYRLIIRSKLPAAREFEKWVVEIVLPTLRKHGAYITPEVLAKMEESPEFTSQLVHMLRQEQIKNSELEKQMTEMIPKSAYFDKLVDTTTLTNIRQTAKELRIPERLFTYLLEEMGFAYRFGKQPLMPYAFMVTSGFAALKEYTRNGHGGVYMLFTPIGRLYLQRKITQRMAVKTEEETQ